jgi:hypothetical protein
MHPPRRLQFREPAKMALGKIQKGWIDLPWSLTDTFSALPSGQGTSSQHIHHV